jgi:protein-L-isoaspartate(D-aspartate) O-methyltransferase
MAYIDFIQKIHTATKRNYLQRVVEFDKAACAKRGKEFGFDYFDGERQYGYGGYRYIEGRMLPLAQDLAKHYGLKAGDRVLDVGCAKGFLLYELTRAVPGLEVAGVDVSSYAIEHAKEEVKPFLQVANATSLPFPDKSFDLVISINTLHNLRIYDLVKGLAEVERVSRKDKYIIVDGYRTEEEKANLMYWQITCECFFTPEEWEWIFKQAGYTGDYACIYYE